MPTKATASASKGPRTEALRFDLQIASRAAGVPSRRRLMRWANAAAGGPAEVTVRVVGLREGRELNRRFRARDYATNVLTFIYRDHPKPSGDIALCAPVLAREARAQGKALDAHYAHLIVHGMLHLQGYDHERARDAKKMEAREVAILRRLGFADPYRAERDQAATMPRTNSRATPRARAVHASGAPHPRRPT